MVATLYDWLLLGHIIAAMVWLGGGVVLAALAVATLREATTGRPSRASWAACA